MRSGWPCLALETPKQQCHVLCVPVRALRCSELRKNSLHVLWLEGVVSDERLSLYICGSNFRRIWQRRIDRIHVSRVLDVSMLRCYVAVRMRGHEYGVGGIVVAYFAIATLSSMRGACSAFYVTFVQTHFTSLRSYTHPNKPSLCLALLQLLPDVRRVLALQLHTAPCLQLRHSLHALVKHLLDLALILSSLCGKWHIRAQNSL